MHIHTQSTLDKNTFIWFTFHFYLILKTAHIAGIFLMKYGTEQLILQNYGKNLLVFLPLLLRNFTGAQFVKITLLRLNAYTYYRILKNDISIAPPDGANAVLNTDRMFTKLELLIYFTASKGKRLFSPKRVK